MNAPRFESEIAEALKDYFKAIETQKSSPPGTVVPLRPHFERLDELAAKLPSGTDPQLRHYMLRKSYEKALEFLQQRST